MLLRITMLTPLPSAIPAWSEFETLLFSTRRLFVPDASTPDGLYRRSLFLTTLLLEFEMTTPPSDRLPGSPSRRTPPPSPLLPWDPWGILIPASRVPPPSFFSRPFPREP